VSGPWERYQTAAPETGGPWERFTQQTAPQAAEILAGDKTGSVVNTISEPIVSLATGTAGAALGGLAGGVAAAIPGLREGIGRDVSQAVSSALTYQPRSAGGKAVLKAVGAPFEWLAGKADEAGQSVSDATGSPLMGAAANTAIQSLPMAAGRIAKAVGIGTPESPASVAARAQTKSMNSVKDNTLAAARAEGYVIPPSAIEPSFIGNRLEGIGGKAAIGQEAALRNQQITNKIARREAGLAADAPITEKALADARQVLAEPYREIAASSPRAASALDKLQEARSESQAYWRHYKMQGDPKSLKEAKRQDGVAKMLESVIDREASKAGQPQLLSRLREARAALAKNHTVERGLNVGSGDVDARIIGSLLDKGSPMTGGLETIGRFAESFRPYARDASQIPTPGVSKVEGLAAAALGMGGHGSGLGWLPAGLPLLSGPARSLMLSQMMQRPRTYDPSLLSRLTSAPGTEGVLNSVGAAGILGQLQQRPEDRP
jgi:hypothetical protein